MGSLREMLNPESVALIGATDREHSAGSAVLANLLRTSKRPLYPVNPRKETVFGVRCYPSIGEVPSRISIAVIVTPAPTVPRIVEACGAAGVSVAIILSSGFGEEEEKELGHTIIATRRQYGMRIIGPNSLGVILPHIGLNATFLTINPKPGNIALIGPLLGDAVLDWGNYMGIGFSMFASLGSMLDVGFGDIIDFLAYDYHTRSVMIYMETVGDAKRFIGAARGFSMSKPIVVFKPGRSKEGSELINMRTGKETGDDRVYDAVFRRIGIVRVTEVLDLFNMAKVLDSRNLPRGPNLAVITNAGDMGIMATDKLAELGGQLAKIADKDINERDVFLTEQWYRDDPVDLKGEAEARRYINTVEVCLSNDGVDGVLVIYTPRVFAGAMDLAQAIIDISRRTEKPVIVTWIGGESASEGRRILLRNNVPAYATPEEAVKTYLYMYGYHRNIDLLYETPAEVLRTGAPLMNYLKMVVRRAMQEQRFALPGQHALDLLRNYRIDTLRTAVVTNLDQAQRKILELGLPLSLTMRQLNEGREDHLIFLTSEGDIDHALSEVKERLRGMGAAGKQELEIILQKQPAAKGFRLKLESRRDPEFQTVLVVSPGSGGPEDVCIGLPPLNQTLARRLFEGVEIYPALKESDAGQQTLARLEDTLLSFSNLVVDFAEIERMELILWAGESEVLAGDVKIVLARECDASTPYPHLAITPYPSHYITTWNLPDGTEVLLRPIRPEDEIISQEMLATLSEETFLSRFFSVREVTHDLVIKSCNMDYDREIAILAEIKDHGKKRMIGGGRIIQELDTEKGEFALLCHDDYQRVGLGAKLIDVLIGIAQEKRLSEIYGLVMSENKKMLGLCRKLGFKVKFESDGVWRVSLPLLYR